MTTITDDEREAREWLGRAAIGFYETDKRHRSTILALLDTPRMPPPDELTGPLLVKMLRAFHAEGEDSFALRAAYRALYDHYAAPPQPKKREHWVLYSKQNGALVDVRHHKPAAAVYDTYDVAHMVEDRDGE